MAWGFVYASVCNSCDSVLELEGLTLDKEVTSFAWSLLRLSLGPEPQDSVFSAQQPET